MVPESKKYIAANVVCQWVSLAANIVIMSLMAHLLRRLYEGEAAPRSLGLGLIGIAFGIGVRFICSILSGRMAYLSARSVKKNLRGILYRKLLRLGLSYRERVRTSEIVQVAVEGVDQLETFFGAYLPQLFYAMLAPLTLFAVLAFVSLPSALVLVLCVPVIPVTIAAVQRFAKKLLAKYWGQYTALGDTFLENLQGLTTTKIYQSDAFKHQEMNEQAEHFRRITMKVLTMQLNSITIMDVIAYGGAALGVILAVTRLKAGEVDPAGCLMILLLAADFFLPMRMLGSFFHIAMNGMAAADKMFRLLDLPEEEERSGRVPYDCSVRMKGLSFSYEPERQILRHVDMSFPKNSFSAIVGESGCGKSTLAGILTGANRGYEGELTVGDMKLSDISDESLAEGFTYVGHQSYLFKGTVRDNLLMADSEAGDERLWQVLERVKLADFLKEEKGLDTRLNEQASNLSGGQRQRLALARALLHDSPVYIFDEATSNIDVESENDIMREIYKLAEAKTVILISHRLANVTGADSVYVMEGGRVIEHGAHLGLLEQNGAYARLWEAQEKLESYAKGGGL